MSVEQPFENPFIISSGGLLKSKSVQFLEVVSESDRQH